MYLLVLVCQSLSKVKEILVPVILDMSEFFVFYTWSLLYDALVPVGPRYAIYMYIHLPCRIT